MSTTAVQFITLASQVLLLLAFFLPLKAVILLGSEVVPHYFPAALKAWGREPLIISVSIAAVLCYLAHMLLEYLVLIFSRRGVELLLKRSDKMALFENQAQIAADAYSRYARGLAAGVFAGIALLALLFIYPELLAVIVVYSVATFLLTCILCSAREKWRESLIASISSFLNAAVAVGFLLAFFCMIADFLYSDHPVVFVAIISLLLIRQGLQRLANFVQTLFMLRSQHRRINALFFHSQPLIPDGALQRSTVAALLVSPGREEWIGQVLEKVVKVGGRQMDVSWHQMGGPGIYSFIVRCTSREGDQESSFLLKLYEGHVNSLAKRESLVLQHCAAAPSLPFLGTDEVQGLACNVFAWNIAGRVTADHLNPALLNFSEHLMAVEPPLELLRRFKRSHQFLEQRLNEGLFECLRIVASSHQELDLVECFMARLDSIKSGLANLPRQLIVPEMNPDTLMPSASGVVLCCHWGNWRMEPIGAGWPYLKHQKLREVFDSVLAMRKTASTVPASAAIVASLMAGLERLCNHKSYQAAFEQLPLILEHVAAWESSNTMVEAKYV